MRGKNNYTPTDVICGYKTRPGFYTMNGATVIHHAVNFTIHSSTAEKCSIALFKRRETEPFVIIPIPDSYRIGDVWSIMVFDLNIYEIEYCYRFEGPYNPSKGLIFDKNRNVLDPYARAVSGQSIWGKKSGAEDCYHGRICSDNFDWGDFPQPKIDFCDLVIYELHVRGFTNDKSSGVKNNGTFAGMMEKISYLKELGINAVELMPIFEFDELDGSRIVDGKQLLNYWGYNTTCFFAPNTSYSSEKEFNREGNELKELIKKLNENGIQVFLDVVFNHTSEGDENGPAFSFKGLDNSTFYMLTPDGHYFNFSGCGNTVNCNHPVVQQFILECLRYWVLEYRVDGFRFDLASIMSRDENSMPMANPPLLKTLAHDPILSGVKLIAEAWDAGGLYQVGHFPSWGRWTEWNGKYRDDLRCFLKGDYGKGWLAAQRIMGSPDIYNQVFGGHSSSVNFINCHDGFTLYDLYSYNYKHNESNGWNNTDGDNSSTSWNCGVEGETDNPEVMALRMKLIKNAFTVLMCSRGAVMFYAGDEFCNTQFGNNNAYCHDDLTSWLDWSRLEKFKEIHDYASALIHFRHSHKILKHDTDLCSMGWQNMSIHNSYAWNSNFTDDTKVIGIMFSGVDDCGRDDIIFLAVNAYWENQTIELPALTNGMNWSIKFNSAYPYNGDNFDNVTPRNGNTITLMPRSSAVICAV